MHLLTRDDGACIASCSVEHAIMLAGYLEGLDVAYRYRPVTISPDGPVPFACFHCGLCATRALPEHPVCHMHTPEGACPTHVWTATVAYLYGASAATAYNPDADLDAIERIVRRGGWQAPDLLVYELIQRYRTEN
jgi:ferredoxin